MSYRDFATNYQRIDKIGEGSYGEVYLCIKKQSGQPTTLSQTFIETYHPNNIQKPSQLLQKKHPVSSSSLSYCALKKLKMRVNKPYSNSQNSKQNVQEIPEIQIMKHLNHDHLMRFQEIVYQDKGYTENYYLVLPLGVEVLEFAKHKQVTISRQLRKTLFYQIIKGLCAIHTQGILHRDIKPSNIFLMRDGTVKIGDFSLSRHKPHIEVDKQSTQQQKLSGNVTTRYYRAPQIMYGSRHYTEKIDIWSLGCTLAQLIMQKPLFPGQTDINQLELIFKVIGYPQQHWPGAKELPYYLEFVQEQQEMRLEDVMGDVETEVVELIGQCLRLDPEKRVHAQELLSHKYFNNVDVKSTQLQKLANYLHDKKISNILKTHH